MLNTFPIKLHCCIYIKLTKFFIPGLLYTKASSFIQNSPPQYLQLYIEITINELCMAGPPPEYKARLEGNMKWAIKKGHIELLYVSKAI